MSAWIDFKKLRRELNFEQVIAAYGVTLDIRDTEKGKQHSGLCPLPACKKKPSTKKVFSANLDQGIWQCFSCRQKGNTLDLIALMEGLDTSKGTDVRKAALIAQERFLNVSEDKAPVTVKEAESESVPMKTVINAPLDFALKSLDATHPWFEEQGLSKKTVEHFDLGYCSKGWLKGRIAIPLHDSAGRLIGYAGRLLDETEMTEVNPLYLFPKTRVYNGVQYEFQSDEFVYRGHVFREHMPRLLVIGEIKMIWHLWQAGYNAIACIDSAITRELEGQLSCQFKKNSIK